MRTLFQTSIFLFVSLSSLGQAAQAYVNRSDGTPMVEVKNNRIEGSPYWQEKWEGGELKIRQTGVWKKVNEIRYNSFKNHVEVDAQKPTYFEAAQVSAFRIGEREFRNGFPPVDFFQPLDYFEVLWEGPVLFLQKHYTTRQSEAILGQSTETTGFSTQLYRYLFHQGKMIKFRNAKQFFQALQSFGYTVSEVKGLDIQDPQQIVQILSKLPTHTP
ncbi:MAG: hypothetical protein ACK4LB_06385 [Spirosomataceae bacterium]